MDYESIIYIDVDTIIRGDLSALFNISLDKKIIAAAEDIALANRLGEEPSKPAYFNAGVLMIDRVAWNQHKVDDIIDKIANKESVQDLQYADQDILNICFQNLGYKSLGIRYNYQYMQTVNDIENPPGISLEEAIVIHYAGEIKPWHLYA